MSTASTIDIRELDPYDDAELDAWHAALSEAERHGRAGTATVWALEELRATMQERARRRFNVGFVGRVGDRVVTTGYLAGSLLDNLNVADVSVWTVPDQRGRGHGSAMLERLEAAARARGRTTLAGEVAWSLEGGPSGTGEPDVEFARRRGYALGLVEIQRQLRLPIPDQLLDELAAEAAPHHEAYRLRSWVGPVPDELIQGWAELTSTLVTEAPLGDLEREPEAADVDAVREAEALLVRQGREKYCTVAVDAAGQLAAYTDIAVTQHESDRAYQWGTLVRPADRGHRLGLAVKVANMRLLQREQPHLATVFTWNAESNDHMIAVNERLGFRPTERSGAVEKTLTRRVGD